MRQVYFAFLLFIINISPVPAHERDIIADKPENTVLQKKSFFQSHFAGFIIPAVFISYGIVAQSQDCLQQLDHHTKKIANKHFTGKIHADDYAQYAPTIAVFGLDLLGVKTKHNLKDRTFLAASSFLISTVCVQTMKRTTSVLRPDGANFLSFPSGHTATSFLGAHLLFKEYKDTSTWIGITGYIVASGTGVMRILNRRHWLSDVITGAGIGILSVEASYLLLPVFQKLTKAKDTRTSVVIAPMVSNNYFGAGLTCFF